MAVGFLLGAGPAGAVVKTVSFDDQAPGTTVDTEYQSSHGVSFQGFDAGDGFAPVVRSIGALAHSGDRAADIGTCPNVSGCGENPQQRTVGRLNPTARAVSAFVGFVGPASDPTQMTLKAFGSNGQDLGTSTVTVNPGAPLNQQVSVTSMSLDIASFELSAVTGANGPVGLDDLAITTPDTPSPPDFGLRRRGTRPTCPWAASWTCPSPSAGSTAPTATSRSR